MGFLERLPAVTLFIFFLFLNQIQPQWLRSSLQRFHRGSDRNGWAFSLCFSAERENEGLQRRENLMMTDDSPYQLLSCYLIVSKVLSVGV